MVFQDNARTGIDILIYHHSLKAKGGEENKVSFLLSVLNEMQKEYIVITRELSSNTFQRLINEKKNGHILEYKIDNNSLEIFKYFLELFNFLVILLKIFRYKRPKIILVMSPWPPRIMNILFYISWMFGIQLVVGEGYFTLHTMSYRAYKIYDYNIHWVKKILSNVGCSLYRRRLKKSYLILNSEEAVWGMKKLGIYNTYCKQIFDIIPPPYNDNFFYPPPLKKETRSIAVVGRFSPEKKFEQVLICAKELKEKYKIHFKLRIVGQCQNKQYAKKLEDLKKEFSLDNFVEFIYDGNPVTIRNILWQSEVYWDFSLGAFGISNAEALACECIPMVPKLRSSSVGKYGLVYTNWKDVPLLTKKVFDDLNFYKKQAKEGSIWVKETYSIEAFKKRWLNVLQKILDF